MAEIFVESKFGKKKVFLDDEDLEKVSKYRWNVNRQRDTFYARTWYGLYMHRVILNSSNGDITDHINGNGLDNRKENLRIADRRVNRMNSNNSRKTKRVYFNKGKYEALVRVNGRLIYLGRFSTKEEGAKASERYLREE